MLHAFVAQQSTAQRYFLSPLITQILNKNFLWEGNEHDRMLVKTTKPQIEHIRQTPVISKWTLNMESYSSWHVCLFALALPRLPEIRATMKSVMTRRNQVSKERAMPKASQFTLTFSREELTIPKWRSFCPMKHCKCCAFFTIRLCRNVLQKKLGIKRHCRLSQQISRVKKSRRVSNSLEALQHKPQRTTWALCHQFTGGSAWALWKSTLETRRKHLPFFNVFFNAS